MEILSDWYLFVAFVGGILIIAALVLFFERKFEDDDVLRIRPQLVLFNIFLNQISFYAIYLLTTFTVDIGSNEFFSIYQVFAFVEMSFNTTRGLITSLAFILSLSFMFIALIAVVQVYKNMLDYCFTVFVIHFIVVSIVESNFPANGAWWTAAGIGLIFLMLLAERISYSLQTMSYQSKLQGTEKKEKNNTNKNESVELPTIDEYLSASKVEIHQPFKEQRDGDVKQLSITIQDVHIEISSNSMSSCSDEEVESINKEENRESSKHPNLVNIVRDDDDDDEEEEEEEKGYLELCHTLS